MAQGPLTVVLTSLRVTPTHVERMLTLQYRDQSLKRTVAHLQFTSWPELYAGAKGGLGGPGSPDILEGSSGTTTPEWGRLFGQP